METPLYEFDSPIIISRTQSWEKDYNSNPTVKNAFHYAYCLYCYAIWLSRQKEEAALIRRNTQKLSDIYRSLGIKKYYSKASRAASRAIAYYYCECRILLAPKASLKENLALLAEVKNFWRQNKNEITLSYASILEVVASGHYGQYSRDAMVRLETLYYKYKQSGIDFYYTSALLKAMDMQSKEACVRIYTIIKTAYANNQEELRLHYMFALSNYAVVVGYELSKEELDCLRQIYILTGQEEALTILAHTLRKLVIGASPIELVKIMDKLEALYTRYPLIDIAQEYAFSLLSLTAMPNCTNMYSHIEKLKQIHKKFNTLQTSYLYGKALFNLFCDIGVEKGQKTLSAIEELYLQTKDVRIAAEYAKGLLNCVAQSAQLEVQIQCISDLSNLYEHALSPEIAREYAFAMLKSLPYLPLEKALHMHAELRRLRILNPGPVFDAIGLHADTLMELKEQLSALSLDSSLLQESLVVHVSSLDNTNTAVVPQLPDRLLAINAWVQTNSALIKKITFLNHYGFRFHDEKWTKTGADISIGALSTATAPALLDTLSISVACRNGTVYCFRVDYKENAQTDKSLLHGKGDWIRDETFSSDNFYIACLWAE